MTAARECPLDQAFQLPLLLVRRNVRLQPTDDRFCKASMTRLRHDRRDLLRLERLKQRLALGQASQPGCHVSGKKTVQRRVIIESGDQGRAFFVEVSLFMHDTGKTQLLDLLELSAKIGNATHSMEPLGVGRGHWEASQSEKPRTNCCWNSTAVK